MSTLRVSRFWAAHLHRMQSPAQLVEAVRQRADGMSPQHAWACVAHDPAHFLPLPLLIAMDGAIRTGGFGLPVRAFLQAPFRVGHEIIALLTQLTATGIVMIRTVNRSHASQCCMFTLEPAG